MNEKYNIEAIQKLEDDLMSIREKFSKCKRVFISIPMNWSSSNEYSEIMKKSIIDSVKEQYKNFDLTILEYNEDNTNIISRFELLKTADIAVFINGYKESNIVCMSEYNYAMSNIFDIVKVTIGITIPIEINK